MLHAASIFFLFTLMVHQGATREGGFFVNSYMLVPVCTDSDVYAYVYFSLVCLQYSKSVFLYVLIQMFIPMFVRGQQSSKHRTSCKNSTKTSLFLKFFTVFDRLSVV